MASAHDVVAAILEQSGPMDQMKLIKLLYYCQAWSYAWRREPMFRDAIEAWEWGPVIPGVYQTYKDSGSDPIRDARGGHPERLSDDDRMVLRSVLDEYGEMTGPQLSDLTHDDRAWNDYWAKRHSAHRGNEVIPPDAMVASVREAGLGGRHRISRAQAKELQNVIESGDNSSLADAFAALLGIPVESGD